jgi:hypothetical protein
LSELGSTTELLGVLVRLRQALVECSLPLESENGADARQQRDKLVAQLDDYIVPRLVKIDAPLLAVVGGSTGAGKSTLVNSVVGERVTLPGVLRPTTRSPVLVHNPVDAHWFGPDRLLPELTRTDHASNDQGDLQLVASERLPAGVAVLDAPDVDSVEERNRLLAAQLLAAADLWLFVTSAARYADQVPWDFLKDAAERSTAVAVVLDRTTPKAVREVASHLARMLTARGLGDSPLFTVPEADVDAEGMLPEEAVAAIRVWLERLAIDAAARSTVVRKTLDGAVRSVGHRAREIAEALRDQELTVAALRQEAVRVYAESLHDVETACADGTLLRGELLARWREFVGTGELMRSIDDRVGRIRDRLVSAARGKPQPAQQLTVAIETSLQTLLVEHAERAAENAARSWRELAAGAQLIAQAPDDLSRASRDLRKHTEQAVREWQAAVVELVRAEGADRRATPRFLAFGASGIAAALMVVVFTQTAPEADVDAGVAGGTGVVGQRILEAVFDEAAVRRLVRDASLELHRRIEADLWLPERQRYADILESHEVQPGAAERLLQLSREVDDTHWLGGRI